MSNQLRVTPQFLRADLRSRVSRILVAVLVGSLFAPIVPIASPTLTSKSYAATTVSDESQFLAIQNNLSGDYTLAASFSLSSTANASFITGNFTGTLDGAGFTISGLSKPLFGDIGDGTSNGGVSNLRLSAPTVVGGGVLANILNSNSQISRVYVSGTLTGLGAAVGGLIGEAKVNSTVTNSYAAVNVSVNYLAQIGGLIGIGRGAVTTSAASGNVTQSAAGDAKTGGLVGLLSGSLTNCFAMGTVTSRASFSTGGLVGRAEGSDSGPVYAYVTKSLATGNVVINGGGGYSGGLVGSTYRAEVKNSYATGNVTAGTANGKLIGELKQNSSVISSYATGTPTSLIGSDAGPGSVITTSPPAGTDLTVLNEVISGSTSAWGMAPSINGSTPYILALETSGFYAAPGSISLPAGGIVQVGRFTGTSYRLMITNGWTSEVWVKFSSLNSGYNTVLNHCANGTFCGVIPQRGLEWNGTDGKVNFNQCNALDSSVVPQRNKWYHIAVSTAPSSASGQVTANFLYINGARVATCTTAQTWNGNIEGVWLGSESTTVMMSVGPYRLRTGQLYTTNFTPPLVYPTAADANTYAVLNTSYHDQDPNSCFFNADPGARVGPVSTIVPYNTISGSGRATCSSDAPIAPMLSALAISPGTLSPTFDGNTRNYSASVANSASTITVTPTVTQAGSTTVQYRGETGVTAFDGSLQVGPNVIRTVVTSQDGQSTNTYTVTVTRAAAAAANATLSGLALSSGTLAPNFSSTIESYTAYVPVPFTDSLTITPTVTQAGATTVQYLGADGTTLFTGALKTGLNVIRIIVTAQDGSTKKTYTVNVMNRTASCSVSGYVRINSVISTTNVSCVGSVDLSTTGLIELNGTFNTQQNVTAVKLPNTLQIISGNAFYNTGIAKLVLPPSITSICEACITSNQRLTSLEMSGSPSVSVTFGSRTFEGNVNLQRVSFGYSPETTLNLTSYTNSSSFIFGASPKLTTINSCAASGSYLATFMAGTNPLDANTPKRINIHNGTSVPTVSCGGEVAITGGGTTRITNACCGPSIGSFTAAISGTSVTLTSGSIEAGPNTPTGKVFQMSTDNSNFTAILSSSSLSAESHIRTGLTVGETYYFRLIGRGTNNYDTRFNPDITLTVPPVSSDARLSALSLSTGTLNETFTSTLETYTASVTNATTSITVNRTVAQAQATTVQYLGATGTTAFTGPLSVGANIIRTVVTASDGTTKKTYTVTVTRAGSDVATLSALTTTAGAISPGFTVSNETYTASVTNATTSVTVTPTPTQPNATIRVNGTVVNSGTASGAIALTAGPNIITIAVTAENGVATKTYRITVTRALSNVATLSGLTVSAGLLAPTFTTGTKTYNAGTVANTVESITVTATPTQANATTVQYLGATGTTPFTGALAVGTNVIRTVVTAQDGTTKDTYSVTVTRAGSTVATLSSLALSEGTLSPQFASGIETYTANVGSTVDSITVIAIPTQESATVVRYLGATGTTLFTGALSIGPNVIRTIVTAQDGVTKKTYTVTVTRLSNVATLSALSLSGVSLAPGFTSGNETYTASVINSVETITVTSTRTHPNATITVNGTAVTSGVASGAIALNVGPNVITVVVTAQDGSSSKTYTATVTRAGSSVAGLASLSLSAGTLSPLFSSATETYTASVLNTVFESYTVTAIPIQGNATIVQYLGATGVTPFTGSLAVGPNVIRTVVTAQDGLATRTYTVTVTRLSNDATLSALALSIGSLSPDFANATESYTATVENTVSSITITPTRFQANSTIKVNGATVASGSASGAIPLIVGSNTITVVVTAQDGITTKTYSVIVTRAASAITTLAALSLSTGDLSPTFTSNNESYTATVGNSVTTITLTPTFTQANSSITINGVAVTSGSASGSIALDLGSNVITVVVTAQDGVTTKTYTVTVTRSQPRITYRHNNCYLGTYLTGSCQGDTPLTPTSTTEFCTYGTSYTILGVGANQQATPTVSSRGVSGISFAFNGWNTTNNGGGTRYLPGSTYNCTEDLRIYVQWSSFQVNFTTGFGGPTIASAPVDPNLYLSVVPTATKPKWTFNGWTRAWGVGSSTASSIPAGAFRANASELGSEGNGADAYHSNYTLCAKWSNAIEFNAQGATSTPLIFRCAAGYETGTAMAIPTEQPVKTNATFGGWYTSINGAGTKVTGNSFTPAAPYGVQTLYAYWLGVKVDPEFGIPTRTANGFVVSTTNYDPAFIWDSATVITGIGSVSQLLVNNQVQLTITGITPGSLATVSLRTSRAGYVDGTGVATGQALEAAWDIVISDIVRSTSGFTASVNYNQDYQWGVSSSLGSAAINSQGKITVSNVEPLTPVTLTVSASRTGYATDIETATATTLERLRVIYDRNTATGGSVPADSRQYLSNETATVLGNTGAGALTLLGNKFEGWTLNSNGTGRIYKSGEILQLSSSSVTLYANWSLLPYFVTYQPNGATSGTVPEDKDAQGARTIYTIGQSVPVYGNTGSLARTGYTFIGWGYNATETDILYKSGDTYTAGAGDITFWARWSADTYTVTYDVNGAIGSPSKAFDLYTTAGTPISLATIGSMQKSGYNFGGWGTSPVSTTIADSYTVTANRTLYAQWSIANYSVTYLVGANGSGTPPTQANVNFGASFTVAPATGLSASDAQGGYAFVSWSDGTRTYAPGQSYVMGAATVTLTAQWTRIYNVKYSFNGGSVATPIDDQQKIANDTITVTSTIPTRAGYNFLNWIDQAGETTTTGSIYTVRDEHYLLYAQWSAISYSVTYDSNGGSAVPAEPNHTIDQIFTVAAAPTKTGHNFAYWNDGSNNYNASTDYKVGIANIVLQAQWIAQIYKISYNFNGGTGAPISDTSYTFGTGAATLPSTGISRADFTFSGWSTSTTTTTGVYSFTPSGDIQLHAVWVSSVYRLTFDAMSGFSDSATAKVTIGQSLVLPGATRANYTFQGWSIQQSGGTVVAGGASYTPAANGTMYAQWALQVFTVTYNGNFGTPARASDAMTYGSTTPISLPTATRLHYVFTGWYSAATGGYLIGEAATNYVPTTSITVHAQWIQLSLYGMGDATQIAQITVQANTDSSFTAGSNGSTATVSYLANSLPAGTVITAYVENSVSRVRSLITVASAPVLSLIIAWVAPDGTVPDTESGTAITMTVFNSSIKAGSKIYGLLGNNKDILGTATVDGQAQVLITKDPAVVVAMVGPDAPTSVVATANGETSAMISWVAPAVNGGAEITGYTATASSGQSCTTTTTSCLITGLTPGASLTFTVVASNSIGSGALTTQSPVLALASTQSSSQNQVAVNPSPVDVAAEVKAAQEKAAAEVKAAEEKLAAELKAAQEKVAAELKAAAEAQAAVKAAEEKAAAELKIAEEIKAAEVKAAADAALAAQLAAKKITPAVSLYSVSPKLTLSAYDLAYLKKYLSTLKKTATVTCIGYTYGEKASLAKATILAKKQATAVCSIVKKLRPTLKTSILIRPAKSAPKAAVGAKWVALSYRVDGFQPKLIVNP